MNTAACWPCTPNSLVALEEALGVKVQSSFAERDAAMTLLQTAMQAADSELEAEIRRSGERALRCCPTAR